MPPDTQLERRTVRVQPVRAEMRRRVASPTPSHTAFLRPGRGASCNTSSRRVADDDDIRWRFNGDAALTCARQRDRHQFVPFRRIVAIRSADEKLPQSEMNELDLGGPCKVASQERHAQLLSRVQMTKQRVDTRHESLAWPRMDDFGLEQDTIPIVKPLARRAVESDVSTRRRLGEEQRVRAPGYWDAGESIGDPKLLFERLIERPHPRPT